MAWRLQLVSLCHLGRFLEEIDNVEFVNIISGHYFRVGILKFCTLWLQMQLQTIPRCHTHTIVVASTILKLASWVPGRGGFGMSDWHPHKHRHTRKTRNMIPRQNENGCNIWHSVQEKKVSWTDKYKNSVVYGYYSQPCCWRRPQSYRVFMQHFQLIANSRRSVPRQLTQLPFP